MWPTRFFWDQVVFFTSKDDNLTKAHVKYLESRMVALALEAKRIKLENGSAPTMSSLPRPDQADMEAFLESARILLGSLGFNFLEPVRKPRGRRRLARQYWAAFAYHPVPQAGEARHFSGRHGNRRGLRSLQRLHS